MVTGVCPHGTMSPLAPKPRREAGTEQEGEYKQPSWGDSDVSKASPEADISSGVMKKCHHPFPDHCVSQVGNAANAKRRIPASSSPQSCTFTTL